MKRRPKHDPVLAARLIPRLLRDLGFDAGARVLRIAESWPEAVGARIAAHSRPLALRGEELDVGVDSSVWCQELQLRLPEMLRGLRRALGDEAPARLRLRVDPRLARVAGGRGDG